MSESIEPDRKKDVAFNGDDADFPWQRPGEACMLEYPFDLSTPPLREFGWWVRFNPWVRWKWRREWHALAGWNWWGWIVCLAPAERWLAGPDLVRDLEKDNSRMHDFREAEGSLGGALHHLRGLDHPEWRELRAMASKCFALISAKRLGDISVDPSDVGVMDQKQSDNLALVEKRLRMALTFMETAMSQRAARYGSTYGRDYCFLLDLLCGSVGSAQRPDVIGRLDGAPVFPNARFSGRRVEFCEGSITRMREQHGEGSDMHRWMLAWGIEALKSSACEDPSIDATRRAWIDELLRLERAAPPIKGMVHLGSAILLAAEDAKRRGDLDEAEAILRQGEVELRGRVAGLPTRYQQIRRELLRNLSDRGKDSEVELLLRDMIELEQQEHTADEMALRTLMGPAIGWMRVRLARLLERQDRIEEAEQVYRASVGDRFGIHPPNHGLGFLVEFLLRQHRTSEAVEAIEEVIRRTRASREPNEHTLMRLLMQHIATIDRYLDRKEDAWRRRIETSIEELVEKARKIEIEPPHNFGSHALVQAAYAVARAGQAEKGIELLRPHLGKICELKEEERRSQVWLITMLAFCLEFREDQLRESLPRADAANSAERDEIERQILECRRERREHLAWAVPGLLTTIEPRDGRPGSNPWVDHAQRSLADALAEDGEHEEARLQLEAALARSEGAVPPVPRMSWLVGRALIDVLEKLHRFDEVMALRERYPDESPDDFDLADGDSDIVGDDKDRDEPGRL